AQLAVFRQVPAGLPHHPERRYRLPLAGKNVNKGLCYWFSGPVFFGSPDTRRRGFGQLEFPTPRRTGRGPRGGAARFLRKWRDSWLENRLRSSIPPRMTSTPPTRKRRGRPIARPMWSWKKD